MIKVVCVLVFIGSIAQAFGFLPKRDNRESIDVSSGEIQTRLSNLAMQFQTLQGQMGNLSGADLEELEFMKEQIGDISDRLSEIQSGVNHGNLIQTSMNEPEMNAPGV